MAIRYIERELFIGGVRHELEHPIDDAHEYQSCVVVLFDPDSGGEANQRFHNLIAVDHSGQQKWIAELPTNDPGDRYYKITFNGPLTAYSSRSYDCVIDENTGRIQKKTFTK